MNFEYSCKIYNKSFRQENKTKQGKSTWESIRSKNCGQTATGKQLWNDLFKKEKKYPGVSLCI